MIHSQNAFADPKNNLNSQNSLQKKPDQLKMGNIVIHEMIAQDNGCPIQDQNSEMTLKLESGIISKIKAEELFENSFDFPENLRIEKIFRNFIEIKQTNFLSSQVENLPENSKKEIKTDWSEKFGKKIENEVKKNTKTSKNKLNYLSGKSVKKFENKPYEISTKMIRNFSVDKAGVLKGSLSNLNEEDEKLAHVTVVDCNSKHEINDYDVCNNVRISELFGKLQRKKESRMIYLLLLKSQKMSERLEEMNRWKLTTVGLKVGVLRKLLENQSNKNKDLIIKLEKKDQVEVNLKDQINVLQDKLKFIGSRPRNGLVTDLMPEKSVNIALDQQKIKSYERRIAQHEIEFEKVLSQLQKMSQQNKHTIAESKELLEYKNKETDRLTAKVRELQNRLVFKEERIQIIQGTLSRNESRISILPKNMSGFIDTSDLKVEQSLRNLDNKSIGQKRGEGVRGQTDFVTEKLNKSLLINMPIYKSSLRNIKVMCKKGSPEFFEEQDNCVQDKIKINQNFIKMEKQELEKNIEKLQLNLTEAEETKKNLEKSINSFKGKIIELLNSFSQNEPSLDLVKEISHDHKFTFGKIMSLKLTTDDSLEPFFMDKIRSFFDKVVNKMLSQEELDHFKQKSRVFRLQTQSFLGILNNKARYVLKKPQLSFYNCIFTKNSPLSRTNKFSYDLTQTLTKEPFIQVSESLNLHPQKNRLSFENSNNFPDLISPIFPPYKKLNKFEEENTEIDIDKLESIREEDDDDGDYKGKYLEQMDLYTQLSEKYFPLQLQLTKSCEKAVEYKKKCVKLKERYQKSVEDLKKLRQFKYDLENPVIDGKKSTENLFYAKNLKINKQQNQVVENLNFEIEKLKQQNSYIDLQFSDFKKRAEKNRMILLKELASLSGLKEQFQVSYLKIK